MGGVDSLERPKQAKCSRCRAFERHEKACTEGMAFSETCNSKALDGKLHLARC